MQNKQKHKTQEILGKNSDEKRAWTNKTTWGNGHKNKLLQGERWVLAPLPSSSPRSELLHLTWTHSSGIWALVICHAALSGQRKVWVCHHWAVQRFDLEGIHKEHWAQPSHSSTQAQCYGSPYGVPELQPSYTGVHHKGRPCSGAQGVNHWILCKISTAADLQDTEPHTCIAESRSKPSAHAYFFPSIHLSDFSLSLTKPISSVSLTEKELYGNDLINCSLLTASLKPTKMQCEPCCWPTRLWVRLLSASFQPWHSGWLHVQDEIPTFWCSIESWFKSWE